MNECKTFNFAEQDNAGHIWAAVWCKALNARVPVDTAAELADAAQKAYFETMTEG